MLRTLISKVSAYAAIGALAIGLGIGSAYADNLTVTALTRVDQDCPIGNRGPTHVYPHMSVQPDGADSRFTSALVISNTNYYSSNTSATVCAFSDDGEFLGGASISLPYQNRLFVSTGTATGDNAFSRILLPVSVSLSSGPGRGTGGGLGANQTFHLAVYAPSMSAQAGFVGNAGQFFAFYNSASVGQEMQFAHFGVEGPYSSYIYASNPSFANSSSVTITAFDSLGRRQGLPAIYPLPPLTRKAIAIADLGMTGMVTYRIMNCITYNTSSNRCQTATSQYPYVIGAYGYQTSAVGGLSVSIVNPQ